MLLRLYAKAQAWLHEARDDRGATAVEYALMVALIAVVIIGVVTLLGQAASDSFDATQTAISGS